MKLAELRLPGAALCLTWVVAGAHATVSQWTGNAAQNWSTATWSAGVPDATGDTANLTFDITAARTLTLDGTNRTVGVLNIGDSGSPYYACTLAATGGSWLVLANNGSAAQINQVGPGAGNAISAALRLSDSLELANQSAFPFTISGGISNATPGLRTIANVGAGAGGVILSGVIGNGDGSVSVVQNSESSVLTLSGANTYGGDTVVQGGLLRLGLANAVPGGPGRGNVAVNGGLDLAGFAATVNGLTGTGVVNNSSATAATLAVGSNDQSTVFSGILTNSGAVGSLRLTKVGTGALTLTGANAFGGLTTVGAGVLDLRHGLALGLTNGGTVVSAGATLQLQGGLATPAEALTLNGVGVATNGALRSVAGDNTWGGAITLGSASRLECAAGSLTLLGPIGGATYGLTFGGAGDITVANAIATTTGSLSKEGGGTLRLRGTNAYTGVTWVQGGTLLVDGSLSPGGLVTVTNGATLGGTGVIARAVTVLAGDGSGGAGGRLAPGGEQAGTLMIGGALTLTPADPPLQRPVWRVQLGRDGWDQVQVMGALVLTNSGKVTLSVARVGDAVVNGRSFTLLTWAGADPVGDAAQFDLVLDDPRWSGGRVTVDKANNRVVLDDLTDRLANVGVTNVSSTTAGLVGDLLVLEAAPTTVWAFWDVADRGTNKSWAFSASADVLSTGLVTTAIGGLAPNSAYYFTYCASNAAGEVWAQPSVAFDTMGPPAVDNAGGATGIWYTSAWLNGALQEGRAADGYFYWGQDPESLTNVAYAGLVREGVYSLQVTGLANDAVFYYRSSVSNDYGTAAAGAITNFATPVMGLTWAGAGSNSLASNPTNWLGGVCPASGDSVLLDQTSSRNLTWDLSNVTLRAWNQDAGYTGTVTILTRYPGQGTFTNLVIAENCKIMGGVWTHPANTGGSQEVDRLAVTVGGRFTLGTGGVINVNQRGFLAGNGAAVNGFAYYPTDLGGGAGGRGGGAVLLDIAGVATIDGTISAQGETLTTGAAGGSILLKAARVAGSGLLNASGGGGGSTSYQAGRGGRIAVILSEGSTPGDIAMRAYGGSAGVVPGPAGTVYWQAAGQEQGQGTLTLDNGNRTPFNELGRCTLLGDLDFSRLAALVITNRAILGLETNTLFDFAAVPIRGAGASAAEAWRTTNAAPAAAAIAVRATNGVVFPNPFVISNYSLCLDVPVTAVGRWIVASNGSLSHSGNYDPVPGAETYRLRLELFGNLTVEAGGAIEANMKGYFGHKGPGNWTKSSGQSQAGSGHGGRGGYPGISDRIPSNCYGSVTAPTTLGSGGGRYLGSDWPARPGAGSIDVTVHGTTTVDGVVSVRPSLPSFYRATGAAGGAILLRTGWLEGTGALDARGDTSGADNCGGGGGGRIAVVLTDSDSFGAITMTAAGGLSGVDRHGAAGTVYRQTASQTGGRGLLTIDNANTVINNTNAVTQLPAASYASPGELTKVTLLVTNRGQVELTSDLTMKDLFAATNTLLYLRGHTLSLNSLFHEDWGSDGRVVYEGGQILWIGAQPGSVMCVR